MHISTRQITSKKVRGNNVNFSTSEIARGFFDHRNYIKKGTWKQLGFFDQRNYIEKVRRNDAEIRRNLVFDVST